MCCVGVGLTDMTPEIIATIVAAVASFHWTEETALPFRHSISFVRRRGVLFGNLRDNTCMLDLNMALKVFFE
jgi:hypothetical protein